MLLVLLVACTAPVMNSSNQQERAAWHAERLEVLRKPEGWLTLVGLDFLEDGEYPVGRGDGARLRYVNCEQPICGTFLVEGERVSYRAHGETQARALVADDAGTPSVIRSGSVSFTLVRRNGQLALRVRDSKSPVRTGFAGIELFPFDPSLAVEARVFVPDAAASIAITNVTGFVEEQAVAAELEFELAGEVHRFVATEGSAGRLFVVFADASNGVETSPTGRFLDVPAPLDGRTTVDFNRAMNPPCSFTAFATCPLAPEPNRLPVRVLAGERRVSDGHAAGH
jgi:hypothetical protein